MTGSEKKAKLDAYIELKVDEICDELNEMFPQDKPDYLKGGFCVEMLMQISEESPALFCGIAQAIAKRNKQLFPNH